MPPEASAQSDKRSSAGKQGSFSEFRKSILNDFQDFRNTLLEQYADFLEGEWHEYESLKGEIRDKTPKPCKAPEADNGKGYVSDPGVVRNPAIAEPPVGTVHDKRPAKTDGELSGGSETFSFFSLPVTVPKVEFKVMRSISTPADYADSWRQLLSGDLAAKILLALKERAEDMGLNDYLTYCLVRSYVEGTLAGASDAVKFSVAHYLLANMGYDIRIAATTDGTPLLLLPTRQKIYARTYMMIDGNRYYAFAPDGVSMEKLAGEGILTCTLPSDADKGKKFDLIIDGLRIPQSPRQFRFEYGPLSLSGEVNVNLMPILYHYPQMPVEDFAISNVSPGLRKDLAQQMAAQLSGMDGDAKVEALLRFMHNVFVYSTDEDFHGFEKPYFLEEMLYYPKNDCEDRAIFYTWFLWNALGRRSQLVTIPGHEAATVEMQNPLNGQSYSYDGTRFYISDPTYIGSSTGMIMPQYVRTEPQVDYTYGD